MADNPTRLIQEALRLHAEGDEAGALEKADRAAALLRDVGDPAGYAAASHLRALVLASTGREAEALEVLGRAVAAVGRPEARATLQQERMELALRLGRPAVAREAAEGMWADWGAAEEPERRAHAGHALAQLLIQAGETGRAREVLDEALRAAERVEDPRPRAALLLLVAQVQDELEGHEAALATTRRALSLAARAGHRPTVVEALHQLGVLHHRSGGLDEARRALEQALDGREPGAGRAATLQALGDVEERAGHLEAAARRAAEASEAWAGEEAWGQAVLAQLSAVERAWSAGRADRAAELARGLVDRAAHLGPDPLAALASFVAGRQFAALGDLAAAERAFEDAVAGWRRAGDEEHVGVALVMLAQVRAERGARGEARRLLAEADGLLRDPAHREELAAIARELG